MAIMIRGAMSPNAASPIQKGLSSFGPDWEAMMHCPDFDLIESDLALVLGPLSSINLPNHSRIFPNR